MAIEYSNNYRMKIEYSIEWNRMNPLKIEGKIAIGVILHSRVKCAQSDEHLLLAAFAEIEISGLLMLVQELSEFRCRLLSLHRHEIIELFGSIYAYLIKFIHLNIRAELRRCGSAVRTERLVSDLWIGIQVFAHPCVEPECEINDKFF